MFGFQAALLTYTLYWVRGSNLNLVSPLPCSLCLISFFLLYIYIYISLFLSLSLSLSLSLLSLSYIYIYIYAVKLLSGPSLGVFGCYYLVQVGFLDVIIWSKFVFLAYKNSGFKRFVLHTQLSFCVFFLCPIFWQCSKNSLFQKKGAKIGFFNFLCFKSIF